MFSQLTGSCRINNYCEKVSFVSFENIENEILFYLYSYIFNKHLYN